MSAIIDKALNSDVNTGSMKKISRDVIVPGISCSVSQSHPLGIDGVIDAVRCVAVDYDGSVYAYTEMPWYMSDRGVWSTETGSEEGCFFVMSLDISLPHDACSCCEKMIYQII